MQILNYSPQNPDLTSKKFVFIIGSRKITQKRIIELFMKYDTSVSSTHLPSEGRQNTQILWGILNEKYIKGLENSPQFESMQLAYLTTTFEKFAKKYPKYNLDNLTILKYNFDNWKDILQELDFEKVILINASWHRSFHRRAEYEILKSRNIPYQFSSSYFSDEEAKLDSNVDYSKLDKLIGTELLETDTESIWNILNEIKVYSYDHLFQTSCLILNDNQILSWGVNKIMPYETYDFHHVSSNEKMLTPMNSSDAQDTIHAEMNAILKVGNKDDLKGAKLFIELMPCPWCAKVIAESGIGEVSCKLVHNGGHAAELFKEMGVRMKVIREM
ncbi:hypothetical protein IPJ91_03360 [bacterium]|nr:MAG: hypothetical protein IPJ91_03360 [bacterium]